MNLRTTVIAAWLMLCATGCLKGTQGEGGTFTFYDQTPRSHHEVLGGGDQTMSWPVATGALLEVTVRQAGATFRPDRVTTSPESVASIESLTDRGFVLKALAAGSVTVEVTRSLTSDRLTLQVRDPATLVATPRPWNWYPLSSTSDPKSEEGSAVLVGSRTYAFGQMLAPPLLPLTGHGVFGFEVTKGAGLVTAKPVAGSDFLELTPSAAGEFEVTFGGRSAVTFRAVTENDIASVGTVDILTAQAGPAFTCVPGGQVLVVLTIYDASGWFIAGATTGDLPKLELPPDAAQILGDGGLVNPSEELKQFLLGRTVGIRCLGEGTARATITWRTFSKEVTVTVTRKG